ncbi:MAG: hypothetical protein NTX03_04215 [Bacteroidetes bacterium]|nr:hypothetical protein [Bacteroidota bacterium]
MKKRDKNMFGVMINTLKVLCLLLILLPLSCEDKNKNSQFKRLDYLRKGWGYNFYRKIDLFERKGIDKINIDNASEINNYPYYGLYLTDEKVNVEKYISKDYSRWRTYKIKNGLLMLTEIEKDEEDETFCRWVSIISKDKELTYQYITMDNYEHLLDITFNYKDSSRSIYQNDSSIYLDYMPELDEKRMKEKYPSFQRYEEDSEQRHLHFGTLYFDNF